MRVATPNRTHFAILGFLTHGPMSGYDIKKRVEDSIDNFWSESFGQLYPALRRLTADGLIEKTDAPSEGGRARHIYSICERGREALEAWLREPTPPPPVRMEMLLKLYFGRHNDKAANRELILRYREQMASDLDRYRSIGEYLHGAHADADDLPYWLLTLRFGEHDRAAHIAWCDETLTVLEELPDRGSEGGEEGDSLWQESTRAGT